jgi:ABC-type glycerol-3-phosphate transport system permease component
MAPAPGLTGACSLLRTKKGDDMRASRDASIGKSALTGMASFYATDQGLTFAGMAIVILPPLLLLLLLQRSFISGLTAPGMRR